LTFIRIFKKSVFTFRNTEKMLLEDKQQEMKICLKCFLLMDVFSGKQLDCRPACPAVDLKQLCSNLHHRNTRSAAHTDDIPDSAFDLLHRLLDLNPFSRITAADALKHPFVADAE